MKRIYVFIVKIIVYKWLNVASPSMGDLKTRPYKWFWEKAKKKAVNRW